RRLGHAHGDAELVAQALGPAAQQRAAAGEDDAAVEQVAGQLRRADVQDEPDDLDDLGGDRLDHPAHLLAAQLDRARQAGGQVAAAHADGELGGERPDRAGADLDVLGGAFAQQQVVRLLDPADDRLVDLVATDADAAGVDDPA